MIKRRILSLVLVLSMLATLFTAVPQAAAESPKIKLGDYVQMGTYYGQPILWRCVDIDANGPLMLSDKIICIKPFDAKASSNNTTGSHSRYLYRQSSNRQNLLCGSNYWGDSNMRSWLNSSASAGNVDWLCGNPPIDLKVWCNAYDQEAGFLTNFTQEELNAVKSVTQKSLLSHPEIDAGMATTGTKRHEWYSDISSVVANYDTAYAEYVTDKMFLLDVKQVNAVYNNRSVLGDDYYIGEPTAECVANSEYKDSSLSTGKKYDYWLRSPYSRSPSSVHFVDSDGRVSDGYGACDGIQGVRPAFYLNTKSVNLTGGGSSASPYVVSGGSGSGEKSGVYKNIKWSIENGVLYISGKGEIPSCEEDETLPWMNKNDEIKLISISEGITSIGDSVFENSNARFIKFPESIEKIGSAAFFECKNLECIYIKGNKTLTIEECAFQDCTSLSRIDIKEEYIKIEAYAFYNCNKLTDVYCYMNDKQTDISDDAFENYTKVHFNNNITFRLEANHYGENDTININKYDKICFSLANSTDSAYIKDFGYYTISSNNKSVVSVNTKTMMITGENIGTAEVSIKNNFSGEVQRFIINVTDHKEFSDFNYRFTNSSGSFGYSDDYQIPLVRYLQAGINITKAEELIENWGGSCQGMSSSSMMFYKGILQEEKYNPNIHIPHEFPPPIMNKDNTYKNLDDIYSMYLRKMIELMQVSQYNPSYKEEKIKNKSNYDSIINELKKNNPVGLALKKEEGAGGHAVVIYDYKIDGDNYIFDIYDCANYVHQLVYDTKSNSSHFEYINYPVKKNEKGEVIGCTKYIATNYFTVDMLRNLYDDIKNKNIGGVAMLLEIPESYIDVITPLKNLEFTNSDGKNIIIAENDVTEESDIEDIKIRQTGEFNDDTKNIISIPVNDYTLKAEGDEEITTAFVNDTNVLNIKSKANNNIRISGDLNNVSLNANSGDNYSIEFKSDNNDFDSLILTGIAKGTVTATLNDNITTITGVSTLSACAEVSKKTVTAEANNLYDATLIKIKVENNEIKILNEESEVLSKETMPVREKMNLPTASLQSGEYTSGQHLDFDIDDYTIVYYTTDGSEPDENSSIYSNPIEINKTMNIKYIAKKSGYIDSDVGNLSYILPQVDKPMSSYQSGEYKNPFYVSLIGDGEIYYSVEGKNPIEEGIKYSMPILIYEDTNINAVAVKDGCISEIASFEYKINSDNAFYVLNNITNQDGYVIDKNNIKEVTKINLVLNKMSDKTSGTAEIVFYNENGEKLSSFEKNIDLLNNENYITLDIDSVPENATDIMVYDVSELNNFSITYNTDCGNFKDGYVPTNEFNKSYGIILLPTNENIFKEGLVFDGWYSSDDFSGLKIDKINSKYQEDTILYAKWSENPSNHTQEPTPEPTEKPMPEPTEEPTPEPTEEPTPELTEEPTQAPTQAPTTYTIKGTVDENVESVKLVKADETGIDGVISGNTVTFSGIDMGEYTVKVTTKSGYKCVVSDTFALTVSGDNDSAFVVLTESTSTPEPTEEPTPEPTEAPPETPTSEPTTEPMPIVTEQPTTPKYIVKGAIDTGVEKVELKQGETVVNGTIANNTVVFNDVEEGSYEVVVTVKDGYKRIVDGVINIDVTNDMYTAFVILTESLNEPSAEPTSEPTSSPTATPTNTPTTEPTSSPTATPTSTPTTEPTSSPTATPTSSPTTRPTDKPILPIESINPTAEPVKVNAIGKYADTINVTDETADNKATFVVSSKDNADLSGITLFVAEYDENGNMTGVKMVIGVMDENNLVMQADIPEGHKYKLMLWDKDFMPIIKPVVKN